MKKNVQILYCSNKHKKKADIEKYDITEKKKSVHYSVTKHYIYVLDSLEIL